MSRWIPVASTKDCAPGDCIELAVEGRIVALFNVDGQFHALDGICPHQGGPLGRGVLDGHIVTCPWHGWQFDATTGRHEVNASLCQPRFAVRTEGDQIMLAIDDEDPENLVD